MWDEIVDTKGLAGILKKSPKTIRYDLCRRPERLPPHFRLPHSRTPLWDVNTVRSWVREQAAKWGALVDE